MKPKETFQDENRKMTFLEKVAGTIPSMTGTFYFQMMQMYLLYFYTDIYKIDPLFIAGLFLVVRIADAVVGPVFGFFIDRFSLPWGKYKPWLLITALISAPMVWLSFTVVDLSYTGKLVYVTITYSISSIAAAASAAPASGLGPTLTKRIDDRMSMGAYGYIFVLIGAIGASVAGLPLINLFGGGNQARGFSILMAIYAILTILFTVFQVIVLKERFLIPMDTTKKIPLKVTADALFKNKTAMISLVMNFTLNLGNGIRSSVMIIYFMHYFHNENLMVTVGMVGVLPTLVGVMVSAFITKRIGIKNIILINSIFTIVLALLVFFIPATSSGQIIYLAITVVSSLLGGLAMPPQNTLMPAAMDYSEWKMGINASAFIGSFMGFVQNLATAVSGAIAAAALSFIGYVPGGEQSSGTIFGLRILMSVVPAIFFIGLLTISKFDLTEEKQKEITRELAERRNTVQTKIAK